MSNKLIYKPNVNPISNPILKPISQACVLLSILYTQNEFNHVVLCYTSWLVLHHKGRNNSIIPMLEGVLVLSSLLKSLLTCIVNRIAPRDFSNILFLPMAAPRRRSVANPDVGAATYLEALRSFRATQRF